MYTLCCVSMNNSMFCQVVSMSTNVVLLAMSMSTSVLPL